MSAGVFEGSFEQKVDDKRRVSVPSAFRSILGEEGFTVFPSVAAMKVLECRRAPEMDALRRSIERLPENSTPRADLTFVTTGMARKLAPDKNGRVLLPENLCQKADIDDECIFVGFDMYFKIYSPTHFKAHETDAEKRALDNQKELAKALDSLDSGSRASGA